MATGCSCFEEFLETERSALQKALIKHQDELSRKLKRKIAKREAEMDFIQSKIWSFSREFRQDYCRECPNRRKCDLYGLRLKKMRTVKRMVVLSGTLRKSLGKRKMKVARKTVRERRGKEG